MSKNLFNTSVGSCDGQQVLMGSVGRGPSGKSFKVEIEQDTIDTTQLSGSIYDPTTKAWNQDWITENINGGHLTCQYIVTDNTTPPTFRLRFVYSRPGHDEWSVLTHPVPYIPEGSDQATAAVSNVFVRSDTSGAYQGLIVYPEGAAFESHAGDPWTVNLTFGIGGNVELPNLTNLSKILGWSVSQLRSWNNNAALGGIKKYIDDAVTNINNALNTKATITSVNTLTTTVNTKAATTALNVQKERIDKLNKANREIPIRMSATFGAASGSYRTYSTSNNTYKLFPIGSNFKKLWGNASTSLKKSEMQIILYQQVLDSTHEAIAKTPNYARAQAGSYRPLPPTGAAKLVYGSRTHIDGATFTEAFAVSSDRGDKSFWIYNPTNETISLTVQCNSLFCFPDMSHPSGGTFAQGMSRGPATGNGDTFNLAPHCMICSTDGLGFLMESDTITLNGTIYATVHAPAADI